MKGTDFWTFMLIIVFLLYINRLTNISINLASPLWSDLEISLMCHWNKIPILHFRTCSTVYHLTCVLVTKLFLYFNQFNMALVGLGDRLRSVFHIALFLVDAEAVVMLWYTFPTDPHQNISKTLSIQRRTCMTIYLVMYYIWLCIMHHSKCLFCVSIHVNKDGCRAYHLLIR